MMENFWGQCDPGIESKIVSFDARAVPALKDNSIDLVFNSPPYVNAIDYQRGHKFSIFWLADVLDTSPQDYLALAKNYVGSDRIPKAICLEKISSKFNISEIDQPVQALADKDQLKLSGIVYSYFESMKPCISEMLRVVKLGQPVIIVVGASNIKGVSVDTPEATAQLAETIRYNGTSLKRVQTIERSLDRDRRQMPITRGIFGDGMKTEHIVVLEKVTA
ncbi:MAG: hypothetical protein HZB17_01185 [Chloroflexi bacterium]|nr:hypothetical protein [Chloroflexota bacterium]